MITIIAGSPTAPRAHIDPFQTCIFALAVPYASTSSLATAAKHIYVKILWSWQSSHLRGLKGWFWVWESEKLIRSIETPVFYRNVSNYHLIDVVTLTDTRRGHMVFLTKLDNRCSSNLSLNDLHWFNMTESYKHYAIPHCNWKPCSNHSMCAHRQSEPVLYCNAGSDWLRAYTD